MPSGSFLPNIKPKRFIDESGAFLNDTLVQNTFKHVVIGMSGGIDSTVAFCLATKSISPSNIYLTLLPCGLDQSKKTKQIITFIASCGVPKHNVTVVNIKPFVLPFIRNQKDKVRVGNIMARVRMIILYDTAKQKNALVLGTENKSEYLLGYFTRFGDEASDIELVRSLYKTHVYEVARHLNIPEFIIASSPTADLWEGQTDEKELGFSYQEADQILYLLFDRKLSFCQVAAKGFTDDLVRKVAARAEENGFKHYVPYTFQYKY